MRLSFRWPDAGVRRLARVVILCCGGWGFKTAPAAEVADADLGPAIQQRVQGVFEKSRDAIVRIEATDNEGDLAGSGFFIEPDGLLYTSYSIGGESHNIVVCVGDKKYPATRVTADERAGVALLKIEARTPFLLLGASKDLGIGAPVLAVGYPMDLPLTPSFGLVGGFDRKYLGRYFKTSHIRASAPIQRGEGGAPLLNFKGEVVGILVASLDQGSALFALPIEAAEKVHREFMRFGELRPGWLGIDVGPQSENDEGSRAVVKTVFPDTPAQSAGLKPGDVLLQVGDAEVHRADDVLDASFFLNSVDVVKVRVGRGNEQLDLQLVPAKPPGAATLASPNGTPPPFTLGPSGDLKATLPPNEDGLSIGGR
jgi:serine protease Do